MSTRVEVAIAQISGEPHAVEVNRKRCEEALAEAFDRGADLVVLPEMIVSGYGMDAGSLAAIAEPVPGPSTEAWAEIARSAGGYIVGGLCERDDERLFNTAVAVGPEGVIGHYRKAHLFAGEKLTFTPGDLGFPLVPTRFGTIGICVCYDLRFVEVVRLMALQGAELICVPTAWLPGFDKLRWDGEGMSPQGRGAEVQANLNQVFIAAASQVGQHGGYDFLGSSILVDPNGGRVLGPLSGSEEEVAVGSIDLALATTSQSRGDLITPRADRRTDLYGIAVGDRVL
jgi:N-carbamoylputrescine amidase